jgi:hypothetical protein
MVDMAYRCMPLTKKEFLKLAFDLVEELKLDHRLNQIKKLMESISIMISKRHPQLSLRRLESPSFMRDVGFKRPQDGRLYKNLKELLDKHNFDDIEDGIDITFVIHRYRMLNCLFCSFILFVNIFC